MGRASKMKESGRSLGGKGRGSILVTGRLLVRIPVPAGDLSGEGDKYESALGPEANFSVCSGHLGALNPARRLS